MGIKEISALSTNPHYYAFLMQNFLSGYGKPCDVSLLFLALPILLYSDSREKLISANSRSKIESLFNSPQSINNSQITGKTRLSGFLDRYNALLVGGKKAIIVLSSEDKIAIRERHAIILKKLQYGDFDGKIKDWSRAAYYLGIIFSKSDKEHLFFFLGVTKHE